MSICILRTSLNLNLGWRRPYNKEKEGQKAALDYTLFSNSNFCPKIHLLLENLHSCEFDFLLKLTKYFVYFTKCFGYLTEYFGFLTEYFGYLTEYFGILRLLRLGISNSLMFCKFNFVFKNLVLPGKFKYVCLTEFWTKIRFLE